MDDAQHHFDNIRDVLREYRDMAKQAEALVPRYFRLLPRAPLGIEAAPAFRGATTSHDSIH
jgi:uncharacterized protein (DUF885 family)